MGLRFDAVSLFDLAGSKQWTVRILAAWPLLGVAGCGVRQSTDGSTSHFRYTLWFPLTLIAVGLVAAVLGLVLRKHDWRLGWTMLLMGPIIVLCAVTLGFGERVSVSDSGIEVRSGVFGMTASQDIPFQGIKEIRIVEEMTSGRRGRMIETLEFDRGNGKVDRLQLNNDVKIEAGKTIIQRAAARKIRVVVPK